MPIYPQRFIVPRPPGPAAQGAGLRSPAAARVGIGHALVDDCSSPQVCSSIIEHARRRGRPAHVITPNAQHIVLLEKDPKFRHIYGQADLVIADGISLLWAARLHGRLLQERIAGVDVFRELSGLAAGSGLKIFLLGGRPGSADLAAAALRPRFPRLHCTTYCPPYGFEASAEGLEAAAQAVRASRPHLLFVGLGAPKQEYWIHDHGLQLQVPVCIGIGGSFELIGGVISRAPVWVQKLACEWAYRVCQEPRRLWRRYLFGNVAFAGIVLRQRLRRSLLNACVRLAARDSFAAELEELALQRTAPTAPEAAAPPAKAAPYTDTLPQSDALLQLLASIQAPERGKVGGRLAL